VDRDFLDTPARGRCAPRYTNRYAKRVRGYAHLLHTHGISTMGLLLSIVCDAMLCVARYGAVCHRSVKGVRATTRWRSALAPDTCCGIHLYQHPRTVGGVYYTHSDP